MPKEIVCTAPGKLEWREYREPELASKEVRIHAEFAAAKHGTEMAFFKGYVRQHGPLDRTYKVFRPGEPHEPYPFHIGNMVVGTVVAAGLEVSKVAVGDRVLAYSGFRETVVRDEGRCWKLPPQMSWKSAVCLDPADFALGAIRDGQVRVGDAVAIFGLGAIGLMAVQIAKVAGAALIIAVDPLTGRRELAKRFGADLVLDPASCDAGLEIKKATEARGADVVIEYSGSRRALQDALRAVAYGGNVVAGAYPSPYDAGLDLGAEAHHNIPNLIFSRACSEPNRDHPRWNEERIFNVCLRLLAEGRISGEEIVTPVVHFSELAEAYPRIATDPGSHLKLGVVY